MNTIKYDVLLRRLYNNRCVKTILVDNRFVFRNIIRHLSSLPTTREQIYYEQFGDPCNVLKIRTEKLKSHIDDKEVCRIHFTFIIV
jgi:hypothetical protein